MPADPIQRIDRMLTLNIANSSDYRSLYLPKHHLGVLYLTATPLADGTPANICIYFIFLETKIIVADSIFIIFIAD